MHGSNEEQLQWNSWHNSYCQEEKNSLNDGRTQRSETGEREIEAVRARAHQRILSGGRRFLILVPNDGPIKNELHVEAA